MNLDDIEIQQFVEQQKNKNTKKKTNNYLNKWYKWCEERGETRNLEELPSTKLDRLLGHFFVSVRKADGTVYEPDTLLNYGGPSQQLSSHSSFSSSLPSEACSTRKRPMVLYDSSDED